MPLRDSYLLITPPVSEVGFSFVTEAPLIDPYDIRGAHDLLRNEYPKAERQLPVVQLDGTSLGLGHSAVGGDDLGVPPRWWFVAENSTELVQVQERFLGWNWRRGVPPDTRVDYPGFEALEEKSRSAFERLLSWRKGQHGVAPPPAAVQLMYDNMIPLKTEEGAFRLGDVLNCWNSSDPLIPVFGWNLRWHEDMAGGAVSGQPTDLQKTVEILTVNLSMVGVISSQGEPMPVLRMVFTAGAPVSSWDEGFTFFSDAHDYIRNTFTGLLTDKIQESWGRR